MSEDQPVQKKKSSRMRGWGFTLLVLGLLTVIISGFLLGFDVTDQDTGIALIALGLGLSAVGLGFISYRLGKESLETMRAMGNLVFHEKIAILSGYLGKQKEQIEHDQRAALEFEKWVEPRLRQEFEQLWQEFYERGNRPTVIKIGGSTLGNNDTSLRDLVSLQTKGFLPVVVHGGGNKITEWLDRMSIPTKFVRGMRVTDEDTLQVVTAVLAGLVNKDLVAAINALGGKAIGLSGIDGGLIQAKIENPGIGYVGEVVKVNPEAVIAVLSAGYIPVIAPGGFRLPSEDNDPVILLNINGDVSASEIAVALKADSLIYLTDVPGIQNSEGELISGLSQREARELIDAGIITGGMIPKVESCLRALSSVSSTQIIDGRLDGALLAAVDGKSVGTTIR